MSNLNFHKNQFLKNKSTTVIGNKIFIKRTPFEVTRQFLNKNKVQMETQPMTPQERLEEQKRRLRENRFLK